MEGVNTLKKLLIHTCCADCALKMIEKINPGIEICLYFYNPNIHPESEWQARKNAVKQVFADKPFFKYAKANGFETFSSTPRQIMVNLDQE